MVTTTLPTHLTLTHAQLQEIQSDGNIKPIQFAWNNLQKHPVFLALESAFQSLFQLTEQAAQGEAELTLQQKAQLIQAWQDYWLAMLNFIRFLKRSIKTEGSEITYALGQACLRQLVAPSKAGIAQELAGLVNDSNVTIQSLIYTATNAEVLLSFDKLLQPLEKYYRTNQQLINYLEQYSHTAKKLSHYDFRDCDPQNSLKTLDLFQQDCHTFIQIHQKLQATRSQLDKQMKHLEQRFSYFLLGPIFKFFWGQQHKMCQIVMDTIDQRVKTISSEVAHHLSGQGSRYLSVLGQSPNDPHCGIKLQRLNHALIALEQQIPTAEISDAKNQLQQSCRHFIDYQQTLPKADNVAVANYLGASLQTTLKFETDYQQHLAQQKQTVESMATTLLTGYHMSNELACNQHFMRFCPYQHSQEYRFMADVTIKIQSWLHYNDDLDLKALDLTTPQIQSVSVAMNRLLIETQIIRQPIEKLVAIRQFGDVEQRKRLTEIIDSYLTNYKNFSCTSEDSQRILEIVFRAGNAKQQHELQELCMGWNRDTLYALADNQLALEHALITIRDVETYALTNKQNNLRHHCAIIIDQLPELALQALKDYPGNDPQLRKRIVNMLEVGMNSKFRERFLYQFNQAFSCAGLWDTNKFILNHETWAHLRPMAALLREVQENASFTMKQLTGWFQQAAVQCDQYLTQLADQKALATLDQVDSIHSEGLQALLSFIPQSDFTAERRAVSGHYLYQAFLKRWACYLDPDQQCEAELSATMNDSLYYINELLAQQADSNYQLIYPQAQPLLLFLTQVQKIIYEAEPLPGHARYQDDNLKKRKIAFLSAAATTSQYAHLSRLAIWRDAVDQYQKERQAAVVIEQSIQHLSTCYRWLQETDPTPVDPDREVTPENIQGNPLQDNSMQDHPIQANSTQDNLVQDHPKNDPHLYSALWHGLLAPQHSQYHQAARQNAHALITRVTHYLSEYERDPRVDRWSKEHVQNLQFIVKTIAVLYENRKQLQNLQLNSHLEAIQAMCQTVSQKECLVGIFVDIVPEIWRAHWKPFQLYDALDARVQRLDRSSPLKPEETEIAKQLADQLYYLLNGKGAGRFLELRHWRKIDETVLYETLKQVMTVSDTRRQQSDEYLRELRALQTHCEQPPEVNLDHTARTNAARQVADTLDHTLDKAIEQICVRTLENLNQLMAIAKTNDRNLKQHSGLMRLFVQRLCFIYTIHFHYCDPNHPVRRYTGRWLVDVLNQRVNADPEGMLHVLQHLPQPLIRKLVDAKAHQEVVGVGDFWKLVDFVNKRNLAAVESTTSNKMKMILSKAVHPA